MLEYCIINSFNLFEHLNNVMECKSTFIIFYIMAVSMITVRQHLTSRSMVDTWKVLKCGAGEGWKRSVGPIM